MMQSQIIDYGTVFEPLFSADELSAFQNIWKNTSYLQNKFQEIARVAVEENTTLTKTWAENSLNHLSNAVDLNKDSMDYALGVSEYSSSQVHSTTNGVAEFVRVAQKAQSEALELLL